MLPFELQFNNSHAATTSSKQTVSAMNSEMTILILWPRSCLITGLLLMPSKPSMANRRNCGLRPRFDAEGGLRPRLTKITACGRDLTTIAACGRDLMTIAACGRGLMIFVCDWRPAVASVLTIAACGRGLTICVCAWRPTVASMFFLTQNFLTYGCLIAASGRG